MDGPIANLSGQAFPLERRKQINTLLIFNEKVSEVKPNHEYRVDFVAGGNNLAMIINLPVEFPVQKPSIRIQPTASPPGSSLSHPWLDVSGNVIGAPGLNSYSSHSDLGRVVQAIKRSLERDPPVVQLKQVNPSYQVQNSIFPVGRSQNPIPNLNLRYGPRQQAPVIAEVADLSLDDLKELETDEKAVLNFVKALKNPTMDSMNSSCQGLRKSVEKTMEKNRVLAEEIKSKEETLTLGIENRDKLKEDVSSLESRVMEVRSKNTFSSIEEELKGQCSKLEDESEVVADEFLNGKLSMEEFLNSYLSVRSSHHQVKAKLDDVANTNRHLRTFEMMNHR